MVNPEEKQKPRGLVGVRNQKYSTINCHKKACVYITTPVGPNNPSMVCVESRDVSQSRWGQVPCCSHASCCFVLLHCIYSLMLTIPRPSPSASPPPQKKICVNCAAGRCQKLNKNTPLLARIRCRSAQMLKKLQAMDRKAIAAHPGRTRALHILSLAQKEGPRFTISWGEYHAEFKKQC